MYSRYSASAPGQNGVVHSPPSKATPSRGLLLSHPIRLPIQPSPPLIPSVLGHSARTSPSALQAHMPASVYRLASLGQASAPQIPTLIDLHVRFSGWQIPARASVSP